jgi:release factor glutamine methyltransferase
VAREAARLLADAGFDEQQRMREVGALARAWLGWDQAQWFASKDDTAPDGFAEGLMAWVARRAQHEPAAYIVGVREFYGRPFAVSPAVLIPRPETEGIVDAGLQFLRERMGSDPEERTSVRVLDIGTGSGCLAITLALECPQATVTATDVSVSALDVARQNAAAWGVSDRVTFAEAAEARQAGGPFDLIVTNPPYVPEADRDKLQPDVRDFEPAVALFGGPDGLDVIRALVRSAAVNLARGGRLVMEVGMGQADEVTSLLKANSLAWRETRRDLAGTPRVVVADLLARSL